MRLNSSFITHDTGDEQVIVATSNASFAGMIRSNKTAAFIVNQLKRDTSRDQILAAMLEKYNGPEEVMAKDVDKILSTLRSIGALDE